MKAQPKNVNIRAKLLWYAPANTMFYGKGKYRSWEIAGKGYGCLQDAEGNLYFVYGNELGGGLYGEDADTLFTKKDRVYLITSIWVNPKPDSKDPFFMGMPARAASITLLNGRLPSNKAALKVSDRIKEAV